MIMKKNNKHMQKLKILREKYEKKVSNPFKP